MLDLQLLFSEWDFYEVPAMSLAYRVLKIFMAGWDLLEVPSWNEMKFPIRECPQEKGFAWFPVLLGGVRELVLWKAISLVKEKYAPETQRFQYQALPPWA